jgi:hypothetical protein
MIYVVLAIAVAVSGAIGWAMGWAVGARMTAKATLETINVVADLKALGTTEHDMRAAELSLMLMRLLTKVAK